MKWIESLAQQIDPLLSNELALRVRRNHGLEHGTVHMLNRRNYRLSGRSGVGGFDLYGDIPTAQIEWAVNEALTRFRRGESQWAVHPNCGTNLVTSGLLTTLVAAAGFSGIRRDRAWHRFPLVMVAMMATSLYAMPMGLALQQHVTTTGDMGDLDVVDITREEMVLLRGKVVVHHVTTR